MPHAITIGTAGNALGQYCVRYGQQINQDLRQSLEFEQDLPMVSCDHAYQGQDVDVTDILQPYQVAFTPNNNETFGGELNILQIGKVDLSFDQDELLKFYDKWRCNWFEGGKDPATHNYPRFIMSEVVLPKMTDELNKASWSGSYSAPTPGAAGAFLETFDGYATKIATAITDTKLTPIATGALVDNTMVAQVRDMCKDLPIEYRYEEGIIEMSMTNAQRYADDYQAKYPSRQVNEVEQDRLYLRVDHLNKKIIGRKCMEGSNRIIIRFPKLDSMIIGSRAGFPSLPQFRIQVFERQVKVLSEFYRFYGFESFKHVFVNDQA